MTSPGQKGKRRRGLRRLWWGTVTAWGCIVGAPLVVVGPTYWLGRSAHGLAVLTVLVWVPALAFVGIRRLIRRAGDRS